MKSFTFPNWKSILLPFLLGAYPILSLLVSNLGQVHSTSIIRPGLLSIAWMVLVYLVAYLVTHSQSKTDRIVFIFAIFFFSYGHVYDLIEGASVGGFVIGRHRFLTPIWIVIMAGLIWLATRSKAKSGGLDGMLFYISLALVIMPVIQIGMYEYQQTALLSSVRKDETGPGNTSLTAGDRPDVYYIILDMYGRSDQIMAEVGYDNSDFIHFLESRGFYVAKCSQSNFNHTQLSLAVSLNMKYFTEQDGINSERMGPYIKDSRVRAIFEEMGYQTVAFQSGYSFSEWDNATYYFKTSSSVSAGDSPMNLFNSFELMYLRTTLLASPIEANMRSIRSSVGNEKRLITLFILNKLKEVPDIQGPKLVFVHLNTTHPPFVFGPTGEPVDTYADLWEPAKNESAYLQGYHDSLIYSDSQMEKVVDAILSKSKTPPIIILQGDHGLQMKEGGRRLDILNAYYLPDGGNQSLYPTISPVNSFRIILNEYFGGNYALLPDQSYSARVGTSPVMLDNQCVP